MAEDSTPTYAELVEDLKEAFTYELCEACGKDLDRHVISPDMFGKPHAWCMDDVSRDEAPQG